MTTLLEAARQALEALIAVEALIEHQYTGTRDGMTAFQDASDDAHLAIEPLRKAIEQAERQSTHSEDCYKWHHACAIARIEQAQKQEPVAWMDGYRNIYSLEEKEAGCEDAVIPLVPATFQHWSDCAVHNEPAYPAGKCDCGGYTSLPSNSMNSIKSDKTSDAPRQPLTLEQLRKHWPLTLEQLRKHWQVAKVLDMTDDEIDFADYVLIARDVEALYGIKGEA